MDYSTKQDLVAGLQSAFAGTEYKGLRIDTSNYIANTNSIDATAMGLDLDSLKKTRSVIEDHIKIFSASNDPEKAQYICHLTIAKKCVEDVISRKVAKELRVR